MTDLKTELHPVSVTPYQLQPYAFADPWHLQLLVYNFTSQEAAQAFANRARELLMQALDEGMG